MTPEQLADEIVALGIGSTSRAGHYTFYHLPPDSGTQAELAISADLFTSDWRVAGAMIERTQGVMIDRFGFHGPWAVLASNGLRYSLETIKGDNLPRAINEACAAALREGKCR